MVSRWRKPRKSIRGSKGFDSAGKLTPAGGPALAFGFVGLVCVSVKNPHNHGAKFFPQLLASGCILEFDALPFAVNQTGFPKNPEMLRQCGLWKIQVAVGQKGGAVHGTVGLSQFCVDANPDGV
jgi:hypothetical protein